MDEYKRFMKHLPVNDRDLLEDSYNEADYVGVQTRLMLLRKYYNNRGNVGLKSLIAMAEKEYPAHLHIDILEQYTGQHGGSILMNALLDHLKKVNCPGVCLGVSRTNERAFGFYRHFGFEILAEEEGGWFLGLKLN